MFLYDYKYTLDLDCDGCCKTDLICVKDWGFKCADSRPGPSIVDENDPVFSSIYAKIMYIELYDIYYFVTFII